MNEYWWPIIFDFQLVYIVLASVLCAVCSSILLLPSKLHQERRHRSYSEGETLFLFSVNLILITTCHYTTLFRQYIAFNSQIKHLFNVKAWVMDGTLIDVIFFFFVSSLFCCILLLQVTMNDRYEWWRAKNNWKCLGRTIRETSKICQKNGD